VILAIAAFDTLRQAPEYKAESTVYIHMEDRILTLDRDPTLLNGDVRVSDEQVKQRFGWRDGLSVLTAAATIVLVIDGVLNN